MGRVRKHAWSVCACVYVRKGARKVRVLFQFSGLFWIIFCRNWKAHCIQSTVWCLCRSNFSLFQYFDIDYATHSVWKMLVKMGLQRYNIISFFWLLPLLFFLIDTKFLSIIVCCCYCCSWFLCVCGAIHKIKLI